MLRINSILSCNLFTNYKWRGVLKGFIDLRLNIYDNPEVFLNNLPISYIFDQNGHFKHEICMHLRDAKMFIGFEHDANDKEIQKLIFLFLIYSLNEYPDNESWTDFITMNEETKSQEIIDGINLVWSGFQQQLINYNLMNEFDANDNYFAGNNDDDIFPI